MNDAAAAAQQNVHSLLREKQSAVIFNDIRSAKLHILKLGMIVQAFLKADKRRMFSVHLHKVSQQKKKKTKINRLIDSTEYMKLKYLIKLENSLNSLYTDRATKEA